MLQNVDVPVVEMWELQVTIIEVVVNGSSCQLDVILGMFLQACKLLISFNAAVNVTIIQNSQAPLQVIELFFKIKCQGQTQRSNWLSHDRAGFFWN